MVEAVQDETTDVVEGDTPSEMKRKIVVSLLLMLALLIFAVLLSVIGRLGNSNEPLVEQQQQTAQPAVAPVQPSGRSFEDELATARQRAALKRATEQDAQRQSYSTQNSDAPASNRNYFAGGANDGPSQWEVEHNAAKQALSQRSQLVIARPSGQAQTQQSAPPPAFALPSEEERAAESQRLRSNVDALRERLAALKAEQEGVQ